MNEMDIHIKVVPSLKKEIEKKASAAGMSVSAYCRLAIMEWMKP